jgi:nitrous oxidase accessory protein NosD
MPRYAAPILIALAALAVLAGCAGSAGPAETPTSSPSASATSGEAPECPEEGIQVGTAEELQDALAAAQPGDVIRLADGTYEGSFVADASGEPEAPIHLCGSSDAVLDGGGSDDGTVVHLDGADHWVLLGFTVQNGQKGVMADGTVGSIIGGLTVRQIGDEAIHLRATSTDNRIVGNTVSDTGLRKAEFGEGIYIGTAESNWCEISDCEPDRSDHNEVVGNVISGTTAEAVDIKEGTSAGLLQDNEFDGSAMTGDADSWVDVKGNDWVITGNRGQNSPGDGFQTHEVLDGWGTGNRFAGNVATVNSPGYGFALAPELENIVACDNVAEGAGSGLANVECRSD